MSTARTAKGLNRLAGASNRARQALGAPAPENACTAMLRELSVSAAVHPGELFELGTLAGAACVRHLRDNPGLLGAGILRVAMTEAVAAGPVYADAFATFCERFIHIGARHSGADLPAIVTSLIEHDRQVQEEYRRQGRK
jgi:hypothetical protein